MLDAFQQFISKNDLCSNKDKILIALSGGIDSVAMLDLFYRAGFSYGIAHCNFKLRADESDQDEIFVRKLAEKFNVEAHIKTCNAIEYADHSKCSIQDAARELRYQWFEEVCQTASYDKIAVAQHTDDQVETFFINLLRGSGVAGLKSIPLRRDNIIRPLLFANRSDIEQYVKEKKLDFQEDSSNSSDKYLRNQIRHQLLPHLEKIKSDYQSLVGNSLQKLSEDHQLLTDFVELMKDELLQEQNDVVKINIDKLLSQKNDQILLFYLLKNYGFNRDVSDSICEAVSKRQSGKMFSSIDYQLLIDRDFLILKKAKPTIEEEIFYIKATDQIIDVPVSLKLEIVDNIDLDKIIKKPSVAYFDIDKLHFPLKLRTWKIGDRFVPFGMKGSKLISDFLIDQKVDRFEKEKIYVVVSGKTIIWVIGYRASDDFKITDKSEKAFVFHLVT